MLKTIKKHARKIAIGAGIATLLLVGGVVVMLTLFTVPPVAVLVVGSFALGGAFITGAMINSTLNEVQDNIDEEEALQEQKEKIEQAQLISEKAEAHVMVDKDSVKFEEFQNLKQNFTILEERVLRHEQQREEDKKELESFKNITRVMFSSVQKEKNKEKIQSLDKKGLGFFDEEQFASNDEDLEKKTSNSIN